MKNFILMLSLVLFCLPFPMGAETIVPEGNPEITITIVTDCGVEENGAVSVDVPTDIFDLEENLYIVEYFDGSGSHYLGADSLEEFEYLRSINPHPVYQVFPGINEGDWFAVYEIPSKS